jgi:Proto-chlorophyllide reductase 57 kD subunit
MNAEIMPWDEAALERLERIPRFVRSMAKDKIEKAARAAGESRVTVAFMDANKAKLMG